jgi:hypothetical protein
VTSKLGRQALVVQKHSPTILFAAGAVGVVGTVILASRATLKLDKVLEEHERKLEDIKQIREMEGAAGSSLAVAEYRKNLVLVQTRMVTDLTKLYGPALVLGIASIAALTGSHVVLNRRYLAVTAAYAGLEKGFQAYRDRVVAELGEDKDDEFRYGVVNRDVAFDDETGVIVKTVKAADPNGISTYARFFDQTCNEWSKTPEYNRIFLQAQQNYHNNMLQTRGHVFLNDVYDSLGLERTQAGAVVGWVLSKGGDNYIDFGIFRGNEPTRAFVNGHEGAILLDFNVDGVIWDKI